MLGISILYLGVVHKLQTLVIQNMLIIGESRDMSRIYIALQGSLTALSLRHFFAHVVPPLVCLRGILESQTLDLDSRLRNNSSFISLNCFLDRSISKVISRRHSIEMPIEKTFSDLVTLASDL